MYRYLIQLPGNTQASVGAVKPFPFECHYYKYAPENKNKTIFCKISISSGENFVNRKCGTTGPRDCKGRHKPIKLISIHAKSIIR